MMDIGTLTAPVGRTSEGKRGVRYAGRLPVFGVGAAILLLSACVPTGPEARRASYLDCARDQGVTVRDGTILSRSAADLARLDACKAVPR